MQLSHTARLVLAAVLFTLAASAASVHAQVLSTLAASAASAQGQASAGAKPADAVDPGASAASSGALLVRAGSDVGAYADSDHVYVLTPSLSANVAKPLAGWSVGGQYLVDAVSAASVDIVATASRNWHEVRHAGTLHGNYKPGAFGVAAQAGLSAEPDFVNWSVGAQATQDLADQNVTLLFGFSHAHDVAGRTGTPFSVFSRSLDREGLKAGVTLLMDEATLLQLTLDTNLEHGDPSKPYRYIPMFAPGVDVPRGASVERVNQVRLSSRPLEQLPLSRDRFGFSVGLLHRFDASTIRLDERLYADTWDMLASTTDARWIFDIGRVLELGPHVRGHGQSAVSFWRRAYVLQPGLRIPAFRTGDRELGPLLAATVGLTLRVRLGPSDNRDQWRLGWDMNLTETKFLDDLYVKARASVYSSLSLEAQL